MTKFFRRNQKKLLAVFAVGLMIAFTVQMGTPKAPMREGGGVTMGHIGDDKITLDQVRQGEVEWDYLKRLLLINETDPSQPQLRPLLDAFPFSPAFGRDINDHPETYALLLEEARRMGVQPRPAAGDSVVNNPRVAIRLPDRTIPITNAPQDVVEKVRYVVQNLDMIFQAENRAFDTVKVSGPLLAHHAVALGQTMTLRAVQFDAKDFVAQAPQPTDEQLRQQFQKYADTDPEVAGRDNDSLGFGYRYPNRIKLQYISIPEDEVKKHVKASRDDYAWELEARKYYLRNPKEFMSPPAPPAPPTSGPASQPATRPAAPTTQPFEQVRGEALERVMAPEIEKLTREIQIRIQTTLTNDYQKFEAAHPVAGASDTTADTGATTQPAPAAATTQPLTTVTSSTPSSLGPPIESYDYLKALAERIQKDFGVLPSVGAVGEFKTAHELDQLPGIGSARVTGTNFGVWATNYAEPFVPAGLRKQPAVLSLFEPSQPFTDATGNLYLVRITAADAAHRPGDMSEAAERVKTDWQHSWAYDQAKAAAQQLAQAERDTSFESAAGSRKVLTVGPMDEISQAPVPGVDLPEDAVGRFKREAFKLVSDLARQPDVKHPTRVIEMPRQAVVYAAELQTVTSDPRALQSYVMLAQLSRQLQREFAQPISMTWFTYQGVVDRLNYVDDSRGARAATD
jgi:hypothetical protein